MPTYVFILWFITINLIIYYLIIYYYFNLFTILLNPNCSYHFLESLFIYASLHIFIAHCIYGYVIFVLDRFLLFMVTSLLYYFFT